MEDFLKALQKDPSLAGRLQKREGLTEFKEKYNVEKSSGLKCPVCGAFFQYPPGSLWYSPTNPTHFVCRKCRLEFNLNCITLPIPDIIKELKGSGKGEHTLPSWIEGNTTGGEDMGPSRTWRKRR